MLTIKLNFYGLLGVEKDATNEQIEAAYKRMAIWLHPDKHPNNKVASLLMPILGVARDTLLDAQKRAEYDLKLAARRGKGPTREEAASAASAASAAPGDPLQNVEDFLQQTKALAEAAASQLVSKALKKLFGSK